MDVTIPKEETIVIPWMTEWKYGPPEKLYAIWCVFKTLTPEGQTAFSISPTVSAGKAFAIITYANRRLIFEQKHVDGTSHMTTIVTENEIALTHYRHGQPVTKKWTRYFTFDSGYTWMVSYNENPSKPKHMLSGAIPTAGRQLMSELRSMTYLRYMEHYGSPLGTFSEALTDVLHHMQWKELLTKTEIDTLANSYVKIIEVFSGKSGHTYDELTKEVLDLLESVARKEENEEPVRPLYDCFVELRQVATNRDLTKAETTT